MKKTILFLMWLIAAAHSFIWCVEWANKKADQYIQKYEWPYNGK